MSSCQCPISVNFDDFLAIEVTSRTIRTSDGKRKCSECEKEIPEGVSYHMETLEFEDEDEETQIFNICNSCKSIRTELFCDFLYGHLKDDLIDFIYESGEEIPEACLVALTPEARGIVCKVIEDYWKSEEDG